ncbi:MAG: glycosyltransferase family 4 protein [Phycisphaeraceae bacterium]|nr:glycosyltransferase family 4 protein [Phycisphaeraceae bacterium]MCW5768525.1 glycosyltransferase family 4 protein [Phycisphaeraceae bacterium]
MTPTSRQVESATRHATPRHDAHTEQERAADLSRPNLVILNQYYVPDVASTGHLLHELAVTLAREGVDVSVLTARPSYGPPETWQPCPYREEIDRVHIKRMWTTRFSKDRILGRVLNYVTFTGQLMLRVLVGSSHKKVYLYTTNPPFLGTIGGFVSLFRRHTYVMLLHDSYPQVAVWVGTIKKGGFIEKVWHRANRLAYRRADQTIVLCHAAKKLVCDTYKIDPERVHVIPNWADRNKIHPVPKRETKFAAANHLVEPFTALYSGNLGLYYEFETMLNAAEKLLPEQFRMVFIGSGGRKPWIAEQIKSRKLTNSIMLPYQPFETLNDSLNACDANFVTIAKGIEGISFPSKLYSSLAVGKPILALSEPDSELRDVVEKNGVGLWFELGDAEGLANGIRSLMADPDAALAMGQRARELFERDYTRQAAGQKYADVFRLADPAKPRRNKHRAEADAGNA